MLNWVSDILQMEMSMTVLPAASLVALCVTVGHRYAEMLIEPLKLKAQDSFQLRKYCVCTCSQVLDPTGHRCIMSQHGFNLWWKSRVFSVQKRHRHDQVSWREEKPLGAVFFLLIQPEVTLPVNVVWNSLHMIPVSFPTNVWAFDISVLRMETFCVTVQLWTSLLCSSQ